MNGYPDRPVVVNGFRYETDLHLTRKIQAVKTRRGEDPEYVPADEYRAEVSVSARGEEEKYIVSIVVPRNFLTDLSSVPWWGRWLVSRVGPHLEASIIHDWLYFAWQKKGRQPTEIMRELSDDVFLAAMQEARVVKWKTWLIYRSIRLCGASASRKDDNRMVDST